MIANKGRPKPPPFFVLAADCRPYIVVGLAGGREGRGRVGIISEEGIVKSEEVFGEGGGLW